MTDQETQALIQQINADPKVDAAATAGGAGFLNAAALKQLGYDVPSDWTYKSSVGRGARGVATSDGFWGAVGKAIPYVGGGLLTGGALAALPATSAAIPATATQAGGVTGGILTGTEAGLATAAGHSAATSLLSQWLVPAITAGTGITGALIQKSAANKATDAQTAAADKALALTEKMYTQDRADMAPYRNIGAFSLGELGHLVGMPANFGTQAVDTATQPRTAAPASSMPATTPMPSPVPAAQGQAPAPSQIPGAFQTLRDLGAARQTASSFVRMRAPTGEEADVASHEVPLFQLHGAQVVA